MAERLSAAVASDVAVDPGARALYTTAAHNYRHAPLWAALPESVDDMIARQRSAAINS